MRIITTPGFSVDLNFEEAMKLYLEVTVTEFRTFFEPTFGKEFVDRLIEILDGAITAKQNED